MAIPVNISDLINSRVIESARIEYKKNWNPETILHSICAFANDIDNWGGGYIIIGIEEENGMPVLPVDGITKGSVDKVNRELLHARIEVVDKPDPIGTGMTEKNFTGPLDRQLRDALSYIRNYIIKEKIIKLNDRAEADCIYNYPYAAIEEALSNAVYHKSYQIGEPVTVSITPEKMEITSLPGPDRTITDDYIKKCRLVSRLYRNRRIGDFLKELRLIGGRNTGIPTMLRALETNHSKAPVFETDPERTYFTVIFYVQKKFLPQNSGVTKQKIRRNLDDIKKLVVETVKQKNTVSKSELASALGYTKVTSTVDKAVKELFAEGRIVYSEPDKPNSRNQKLVFVDSGS